MTKNERLLLGVALLVSLFFNAYFIVAFHQSSLEDTVMKRKFFDIYVKPFENVYENPREKTWKLKQNIRVKGVLITISTWELVPVKVGVCLDGAGVDAGTSGGDAVLACLTTPASGGGSSSIYVPLDDDVEMTREITIYVWAHNMREEPVDFHLQVIIYYEVTQ